MFQKHFCAFRWSAGLISFLDIIIEIPHPAIDIMDIRNYIIVLNLSSSRHIIKRPNLNTI